MMQTYLVCFTVPGMKEDQTDGFCRESPIIQKIQNYLNEQNIRNNIVDSVAHWGCPNQSWLEFYCELEEVFCWQEPLCLSDIWQELLEYLNKGELLMMVFSK